MANQDEKKIAKTPLQQLNENGAAPKRNDLRNIVGLIDAVTAIPTGFPKTFWDSIKLYESGATKRLYLYNQRAKAWRYVALT